MPGRVALGLGPRVEQPRDEVYVEDIDSGGEVHLASARLDPNSVRPPDLVTHQLEAFEEAEGQHPPGLVTHPPVAVVSDELSYRWQQADIIEELKAKVDDLKAMVVNQAEVDKQAEVIGELKADQLKLQVEVDELKAMVNQLKLQVEQLQVAGAAPVQARIVQVDVVESC